MPLTPKSGQATSPRQYPQSPLAAQNGPTPLLLVDIDGVISLFGFPRDTPPAGSFHWIDGIPHFLSATAAQHLLTLAAIFELVWCSGWEERANEHLPHLLGLPQDLPFLRFERTAPAGTSQTQSLRGHWKLEAIDAYAGDRPLAWVDDCLDAACHEWAQARTAPTLLVQTAPDVGLTELEATRLAGWAAQRLAN
ncbi:MAG TPA: HAD domain-containing protein [Solirubrobacteraceae bacterium]|jgi:hypothetical protein